MKKAIIAALLFAALTLSGCGEKIIAKVGDKPITQSELNSMKAELKNIFKDKKDAELDALALQNLEAQKAVELKAQRDGIKVNDDEVNSMYEQLKGKVSKEQIKDIILSNKLFIKYTSGIKVTPDEVKQYYLQNKNKFAYVNVYGIVTNTKDNAEKVYSDLKSGTDFSAEYSKYAVNVHDVNGYIGQYPEGTDIDGFKVKSDTISQPVKTGQSYEVFKTGDLLVKSFDDVKDAIEQVVLSNKKTSYYNSLVQKWIKEEGVKVE
ncbi:MULTISPECIES: peptidyl-prolyl cis-trans isomerase [Thermoanaerobacterium]|uniref:peptidylprolyl isomerase n=2 Tax=Thermoanaerobacterium TaxID=28895 RepID=W9E9U9_9THEO|nr:MULTISPECIES: peptidyl-prolyl cis-trans isomerase [Thermoanaerobacterium]AFK85897.1 parvulin-like peptidyl-prolyl isomerase [Thermoanaerobacterium saccharolyticum JW/SL-YS485]ETO38763.1 parvulin-like peptidyl-prolyl isomerase [Thermoanaerobacterium aotearoense SCUT27]